MRKRGKDSRSILGNNATKHLFFFQFSEGLTCRVLFFSNLFSFQMLPNSFNIFHLCLEKIMSQRVDDTLKGLTDCCGTN